MIVNKEVKIRIQYPDNKNNWLYSDDLTKRLFKKKVLLGINAQPWQECTEEEKQEWINTHKEDYPELFEEEVINE